jgi:hypothetical protein
MRFAATHAAALKNLAILFGTLTAAFVAGLWTWKAIRRWRRKSPDEIERLRRAYVNACGRIVLGRIVELAEPVPDGPAGPVVLYDYEVGGVTYETAQDISSLPKISAVAPFLPGQVANVKYDPKRPTNSIVACEDWCGIPNLEPPQPEAKEGPAPAAEMRQEKAL